MGDITLTICGTTLPLRETLVKKRTDGRTYHTLRAASAESAPIFGHAIQALATDLPTSVTVDGVEVALTAGLTAAEDKKGNKLTQRKKVSADVAVTLPSLGEERMVHISISEKQDNLGWQLKASINRKATGGGSVSPERMAATLADLLAG